MGNEAVDFHRVEVDVRGPGKTAWNVVYCRDCPWIEYHKETQALFHQAIKHAGCCHALILRHDIASTSRYDCVCGLQDILCGWMGDSDNLKDARLEWVSHVDEIEMAEEAAEIPADSSSSSGWWLFHTAALSNRALGYKAENMVRRVNEVNTDSERTEWKLRKIDYGDSNLRFLYRPELSPTLCEDPDLRDRVSLSPVWTTQDDPGTILGFYAYGYQEGMDSGCVTPEFVFDTYFGSRTHYHCEGHGARGGNNRCCGRGGLCDDLRCWASGALSIGKRWENRLKHSVTQDEDVNTLHVGEPERDFEDYKVQYYYSATNEGAGMHLYEVIIFNAENGDVHLNEIIPANRERDALLIAGSKLEGTSLSELQTLKTQVILKA